jgi:hypothetical protein
MRTIGESPEPGQSGFEARRSGGLRVIRQFGDQPQRPHLDNVRVLRPRARHGLPFVTPTEPLPPPPPAAA